MSKLPAKTSSKDLAARIERAAHMVYLDGANEAQIAKALGIQPVTVRDWKRRPEWSAAVAELREHQRTMVLDRLAFLTVKAADAVAACLDSSNDAVRLKAAQWVLEGALPVAGERNRATDAAPLGEVEVFMQLVAIGVDK